MHMSIASLPGEVTRIALAGSLDAKGAAAIGAPFAAAAAGGARVVVDFAAVDYIASSGLRMLLGAARTVGRGGGKLVLCNLTASVAKVFGAAGMEGLLPALPTLAAAVAAVAPRGST